MMALRCNEVGRNNHFWRQVFQMLLDDTLPQFSTVPMDQFPLKWRFTDPKYRVLPPIHLVQVKPLTPIDARRLWDTILQADLHNDVPFTNGYFRTVDSTVVGDSHENQAEDRRVRKWLFQRGIHFRQRVLLSYQPEWAIETTWKMLIKYWTDFYYPISDDLTVFDGSFKWALLFYHEHEIFFGSNLE
jgi:hypothetical protein